jgi:hypothetical protein
MIGRNGLPGLPWASKLNINSAEMRMPCTIGLPPKMAGSVAILATWLMSASGAVRGDATVSRARPGQN